MKQFLQKIQKDLTHIQTVIQKEGNDLVGRVKKLDLKDNIETKKKELEKVVNAKLKKIEPAYNRFVKELKSNALKAGIDLSKIEKELLKKAAAAKTAWNTKPSAASKKTPASKPKSHSNTTQTTKASTTKGSKSKKATTAKA